MKIHDAVHALVLFDQKQLIPWKTQLKGRSSEIFKFIRVDTRLNWPRLIVQDAKRQERIFNGQELRKLELQIMPSEITVELCESDLY